MPTAVARNYSLEEMDIQSLLHPVTSIAHHVEHGPTIVTGGHGARIKDQRGRELIDCGAGLWCVNVGYGRTELAEAASRAMRELGYFHLYLSHSNEPAIRLADRLLTLLHDRAGLSHLSKVFFGSSGSDANETNLKITRYYNNLRGKPAKKKVISRLGSYHGMTLGSGSMTGIPAFHARFDLPIDGILHTPCPHFYRYARIDEDEAAFTSRMIGEIKDLIVREGAETIAAFVAEPVMGTGGVLMPPAGYFEQLQSILAEEDILLIADEVITGIGRLGSWFASGQFQIKPDFVTLAKGLTSGYFPMSASVVSDRVWQVLCDASPSAGLFMHGFTYTGHPVGSAVGLANLDIVERERLVERSAMEGGYFLEQLRERLADHPYVGDIRGLGLMIGVEFVADPKTRRPFEPEVGAHRTVATKALANGILVRPLPFIEVVSFSPPLTIARPDIDQAVDAFVDAVEQATPELRELA